MFDISRIQYYLPILAPAQVVHYTRADDLAFTKRWINYLLAHDRIAPNVDYREVNASGAAPRLIVSVRDGLSERSEHLRLGKSLILQDKQLTVMHTDVLPRKFLPLPDPFDDDRHTLAFADRSLTIAGL